MVTTRLHRFSREKDFLRAKLKRVISYIPALMPALITKYVSGPRKRKSKEEIVVYEKWAE